MRIKFNFTKNTTPVNINNQSDVNYYIHKCLGENNPYHDAKNDYSISNLQGGKLIKGTKNLQFDNGGFITVTSLNTNFINDIIGGIMSNPQMKWGMVFKSIDFINENFINGWNHFATLSPFIIKKYVDKNTYSFATINDDDFNNIVKNHIVNKLTKIYPGIKLENFDVQIKSHPSHKVTKVRVKNVLNIGNQCHVSIFTTKDVAEKIYNLGLGQSTGSGFGTIYKTENRSKYKLE